MKYILELKIFCCFFNLKNVLNFLTFWILLFIIDMLCFIINFLITMENYELASKDIKQIDWVTSQVKNWLSNIKENVNQNGSEQTSTETPAETPSETPTETSTESGELFYEIDNEKVILKMDIVKSYLEKIKDKERNDLKASNAVAWIMAVQIAIRSPQVWWGNKDKYWDIVIDGILWSKTKEAVEKFQTEYKLKVDGLPGKETMNKIYDILTWNVQTWTWMEWNTDSWGKEDNKWENSEWSKENSEGEDNWIKNSQESEESVEEEPKDTDIVSVEKYIPSIKLDMRYATTNNFTWKKIYDSADAKLRYWTIKKLKKAQNDLQNQWYSIKIRDAYRPQSAQEKLWSIRPDSALVANPKKWSAHTKWNTVDITLVKSDWSEISMPSEFDDSNKKRIDRDYNDLTSEKRTNAKILEDAMKKAGFVWYDKEWWHYSDSTSYPMERGE